jgi:carbonic anhydrase
LFVVRVAGNVVDSPTLGSVEYGVEHLHAKVVLVLGHGSCGAVKASLAPLSEQAKLSSNIRFLLDRIVTGPSTDLKDAAIENVRAQLSLLASDPIIEEEIAKGQVALVGGFYDIATGKVEFLK